ncbi:MAG: TetR/AcrR family transcriptional regulator C-terminal domain-containing protein [Thiohalophilus sp.]|uniref:TetR/AcrR family transcriptional regulator n=1 Tax=Thiohalophilus sp. TaxID=3028392 RepID=UPI0028703765|nr:TetR/AcrR family transcriptional regulator C-terminal domain-containing protein [Thiohalophilus sp.]MDR9435847.1 TetR/AcrR family transcriptional regulator C-terminal domain-containing protein [Thiohalophilus sp.]
MSKNRHLPADERKELTVRAVVDLCGREDPARITTASIAKYMQVTQGALFRHFPSKEAIWTAVVEWVAERVMQRLERAAQQAVTPLATLEAMFMAHIDFITEHPGVPRMMMGQLQHARPTPARRMVQGLMSRYHQRLEALLEEGRARGELRADLDSAAAATQFIGTIQGLVMQSLIAGEVGQIRDLAPGAFRLYCQGIAAQRSGTP